MTLLKPIQLLLSCIIFSLLIYGLILWNFKNIFWWLALFSIIQLYISFRRKNLLNILFELPLILCILIGYIPYLGAVFRILAIVPAFLDLFANLFSQNRVEMLNLKYSKNGFYNTKKPKPNSNKSNDKTTEKVVDASFQEKEH